MAITFDIKSNEIKPVNDFELVDFHDCVKVNLYNNPIKIFNIEVRFDYLSIYIVRDFVNLKK